VRRIVGYLPRRLWLLLALLLTVLVMLASSSEVDELYVPSASVEDVVAAFYLALSVLLALGVFSIRHELAEALKELLRREPTEEGGRRRVSPLWLILNVVFLAVAYFLTARRLEEQRWEARSLLEQAVNVTSAGNMTQAVAPQSQAPVILAEGARSALAAYAPLAALAAILLALLSVVLALVEEKPPLPEGLEESFRESFLREASTALESLRLDADVRRVILELYYSLCRELRKHGVGVTAEKTAREVMHEALKLLPAVPTKALETLTYLFEKAAYSDHPLHDEDKEAAEWALTQVVSSLRGSSLGGESEEK